MAIIFGMVIWFVLTTIEVAIIFGMCFGMLKLWEVLMFFTINPIIFILKKIPKIGYFLGVTTAFCFSFLYFLITLVIFLNYEFVMWAGILGPDNVKY